MSVASPNGAAAVLALLRPKQWTKNGLLIAALVFSGHFLNPSDIARAFLGIAAFCMLSSAGYVLNDWLDVEADRNHPKKRFRPIASGAVSSGAAFAVMGGLLLGGAALSWSLSPLFFLCAMGYLATTLSYSLYFKHLVILDVMFLSGCYVWRGIAGAVAINVLVSPWMLLCTAFFALFLGFHKRRAELVQLGDGGGTRKNLAEYSPAMLDQFQAIVTSGTVLSYALYSALGQSGWMMLTMPYVLYGVFRYIYLVDQKGEGGAPDETFLKDRPILATVFLFLLTAGAVIAAEHRLVGQTP